jgi:hypothetical protein
LSGSQEDARRRAAELDEKLVIGSQTLILPAPKTLFFQIRRYLEEQGRRHSVVNAGNLVRFEPEQDTAAIELGPQIDKGPTAQHFSFRSGARLTFGVTVRKLEEGAGLLSYRFYLRLPERCPLTFLRFDLNAKPHEDPLREPRCHIHLGLEHVRVPSLVLSPLEVLDRLFFVIEPALAS